MQSTTQACAAFARAVDSQNIEWQRALAALAALEPTLEFFIAEGFLEELQAACAVRVRAHAAHVAIRV